MISEKTKEWIQKNSMSYQEGEKETPNALIKTSDLTDFIILHKTELNMRYLIQFPEFKEQLQKVLADFALQTIDLLDLENKAEQYLDKKMVKGKK